MTSLEYYIEQVEQFISALTDDIESGEGTVVTQTKLAVYREVLEHLEEIEQESCEDAISRQAVLDKKELVELEDGQSFYCISPEDVETLPPVTPQQKIGHWILTSDDDLEYCTCSECGYQNGENWMIGSQIKFCQECGAKMIEPQKSEVNNG